MTAIHYELMIIAIDQVREVNLDGNCIGISAGKTGLQINLYGNLASARSPSGRFVHSLESERAHIIQFSVTKDTALFGGGETVKGLVSYDQTFFYGLFIMFYDGYEYHIKRKWGSDPLSWPATIGFARIIRNGCAHGGAIEIHNPNIPPVTWRGIDLSPQNNKQLFLDCGITIGALILLIVDVCSVLDEANIPASILR